MGWITMDEGNYSSMDLKLIVNNILYIELCGES